MCSFLKFTLENVYIVSVFSRRQNWASRGEKKFKIPLIPSGPISYFYLLIIPYWFQYLESWSSSIIAIYQYFFANSNQFLSSLFFFFPWNCKSLSYIELVLFFTKSTSGQQPFSHEKKKKEINRPNTEKRKAECVCLSFCLCVYTNICINGDQDRFYKGWITEKRVEGLNSCNLHFYNQRRNKSVNIWVWERKT